MSDRTGGRIPRLLESIEVDEVLFLMNAIYFKGRWRAAFEPGEIRPGPAAHGARRAGLRELVARFGEQTVNLTLPRFRLDWSRRFDPISGRSV